MKAPRGLVDENLACNFVIFSTSDKMDLNVCWKELGACRADGRGGM